MIPFGQAIAVTPIQMISAINCIANKGVPVNPTILKRVFTGENKLVREYTAPKQGKQVISTEIAEKIVQMMKQTVDRDGGTGTAARIPGYSVAGKTGTAEKADQFGKGYIKNEYVASFVGFVPANQPKLSILVILDTPRYGMYGGTVAAPVFKEVAEAILYYMNISPDRSRVVMVP